MKKIYWIAILLGIILTPIAHKFETTKRGYAAIGGEFFIIPFLLILVIMLEQIVGIVNIGKEKSL